MASLGLFRLAIPTTSIHSLVSLSYSANTSHTDASPTVNFFDALNYLGVPTEFDQAEGITAGAAFVPTDISPTNQTRADACVSYYDPYSTRANFHVMTGQHVTRLIIEGIPATAGTENPTSGGNNNGEGTATGNTGGLNFGPGDEPPSNPAGAKFIRQTSSSNLRVLGVEVRFVYRL